MMDAIVALVISGMAIVLGVLGLFVLAIWKFKPKEKYEKNPELNKKTELILGMVLILLGVVVYFRQMDIIHYLTHI